MAGRNLQGSGGDTALSSTEPQSMMLAARRLPLSHPNFPVSCKNPQRLAVPHGRVRRYYEESDALVSNIPAVTCRCLITSFMPEAVT
jgi:hypothetical protein